MSRSVADPIADVEDQPVGAGRPLTMVEAVAKALAAELTPLADGSFLGSEDQLSRRFGLSKPTLRQAARLLEHRELLVVKRGVNGGYYARRPSASAVAVAAAAYLRAHATTHAQLTQFQHMYYATAARMAAGSRNADLRAALAQIVERLAGVDPVAQSSVDYLSDDDALSTAIIALAENPMIDLTYRIAFDFGALESGNRFGEGPEFRQTWRDARLRLARAVLGGDGEAAEAAAVAANALVDDWMLRNQAVKPRRARAARSPRSGTHRAKPETGSGDADG